MTAPHPATLASCLVCGTSLSGLLGAFARLGGVRRSPQNPNLCNRCNGHIEEGRVVELAVFFADLTGYTLAELQCPTAANDAVCAASPLYTNWELFLNQDSQPAWDFGTTNELPGLLLDGFVYRNPEG